MVLNAAELIGLLPKEGRDHMGREKMHTAAKSNLVFTENFSLDLEMLTGLPKASRQAEFYQQITRSLIKGAYKKQSFIELGNRLVAVADRAYALRQMDVVEQASLILLNLPLPRDYRSIAQYYQAYCIKRSGQFEKARPLFERVAEEVPSAYKARAIVALGSIAFDSGDYKSAFPLYLEAGRAATQHRRFDPLAAFFTGHMLAVLRSMDGDHRGALADLERMFPLIRSIGSSYSPMYHNYLNSLAVEMIEVGRLEEAQNLSKIVLATPYANAYSEWRETGADLAVRGYRTPRSVVSFAQRTRPQNLIHLPEREYPERFRRSPFHQPRGVTKLADWKKKMVKEPNGDQDENITSKDLDEMSEQDMIVKIFRLSSHEDLTREQLRDILDHIIKVTETNKSLSLN
jgi:tetratricopeptide (TPR) repeat protein